MPTVLVNITDTQKTRAKIHYKERTIKYANLRQFLDQAINTQINKDLNEEACNDPEAIN